MRVDCLERRPPFLGAKVPVTTIEIFIPRDPSLHQGIRIVSTNFCGANKIYCLPQGLGQYGLLLSRQGKLEMVAPETVQEGGVSHSVLQVRN